MADVNQVFMTGEVTDYNHEVRQSQNGSWVKADFKVATEKGTPIRVSLKNVKPETAQGFQDQMNAIRSQGGIPWIAVWPGNFYATKKRDGNGYFWGVEVSWSSVRILPGSGGTRMNIALIEGVVNAIDGDVFVVACRYSYYDKKTQQTVWKERLVTCMAGGPLDQAYQGWKILGSGVLYPKTKSEWRPYVSLKQMSFFPVPA